MNAYSEIYKLRNQKVSSKEDSIKLIKNYINNDIVPFVPLKNLLIYFKESFYIDFPQFLEENYTKCAWKYYFGYIKKSPHWVIELLIAKGPNFIKRIPFFKKRIVDPIFKGSYQYIAMDLKTQSCSTIIIGTPSDYILFSILTIRPLTNSEYKNLIQKYPETIPFVKAAMGLPYEKLFHEILEKKTNTNIPFTNFILLVRYSVFADKKAV
jgi:hypothetical protein